MMQTDHPDRTVRPLLAALFVVAVLCSVLFLLAGRTLPERIRRAGL